MIRPTSRAARRRNAPRAGLGLAPPTLRPRGDRTIVTHGEADIGGDQLAVEPLLVRISGDAPEPLGEGPGIAVSASGADLRAARPGFQVASVHSIVEWLLIGHPAPGPRICDLFGYHNDTQRDVKGLWTVRSQSG